MLRCIIILIHQYKELLTDIVPPSIIHLFSLNPGSGVPIFRQLIDQIKQAIRMNLFVLVRILFLYLERVDRTVLDLAKEVSI